jgi:RimJ/RimL family protein N-acetyltransferase
MFLTQRLAIRLIEERDLEEVRLFHNEFNTLKWLSDIRHISQEEQINWHNSLMNNQRQRRYVARKSDSQELVGIIRLDKMDLINRSVEIGVDIVEKLREQGYASEIYLCFLDYLFDQMGIHRLSLVTLETNNAGLGLYNKLGFVREGIMKDAIFREGKFQDLIIMRLLKNERALKKFGAN